MEELIQLIENASAEKMELILQAIKAVVSDPTI